MSLPTISRREAVRGRFFDARAEITQRILWAKEPVVLVVGPLGTGKTMALLEKMRACCLKYPGSRWLLSRSVRKWLSASALVTWEEKVGMPQDLVPDRIHRQNRSEYRFRNGSTVDVRGLDDPVAVRSAEYDGAYILEATEVTREVVDEVRGRLRNGVMPYQQLLLDCNPSTPTHWLKQWIDTEAPKPDSALRHLEMRHRDNPALYDLTRQDWTERGTAYMRVLDDLHGSRRLRLRDGKWAQAEGVVYEGWDSTVHVINRFPIPGDWRRWIAVDFGFTNPCTVQWWAEDPDGRLYLYREIYHTAKLVSEIACWANQFVQDEPKPQAVVCDHDPEGIETFRRATGLHCVEADKTDRKGGIQFLADRLKVQPDGKARLYVFRDSLCHQPDPNLIQQAKPTNFATEIDGYIWNPNKGRTEEPLKENDHAMDAGRYLCTYVHSAGKSEGYGAGSGPRPLGEGVFPSRKSTARDIFG
jgi:phage terminase large subunit